MDGLHVFHLEGHCGQMKCDYLLYLFIIWQVLIRLPNGERKERRFQSSAKVSTVYDYVDSLGTFDAVKYSLVTNFPRVVYGPEKQAMSLKDAGLHPHTSLFVSVEDS